jgi:hypothetical protein
MAETIKKTKAPAKPRTSGTTKKKAGDLLQMATPPREKIEELARSFWAQRGYQDGYAEQDWLRAEQELRGMAS